MLKQDDCIAVFDVGKTNKKLLIYTANIRALIINPKRIIGHGKMAIHDCYC
jgi:hypothetical protein